MIGALLTTIGTFFSEISVTIGRDKVLKNEESRYSMGFLDLFFSIIFFVGIAVFNREAFWFSTASLPTFLVRAILELIQVYIILISIIEADRSTFGFLRTITIPLLLVVDIVAGYVLNSNQIVGIGLIFLGIVILFLDHDIKRKGAWLVLFGSVNAVATMSLYKYNITNFNSVVAEQMIMHLILLGYLIFASIYFAKQNPFKFLTKQIYFLQSLSMGVASLMESFAFVFAPASVIIAVKRATAVLWSMLSGTVYFHERHFLIKLMVFVLVAAGITLIIL